MGQCLALIFGGVIGTAARFLISMGMVRFLGSTYPHGTFVVNLLGCFLMGIFISRFGPMVSPGNENAKFFLMIGFCGAFTTFSTLILETSNLMQEGRSMGAFLNIALSILFGLGLLWFGMFLGEKLKGA